jgi:hypothetical protein
MKEIGSLTTRVNNTASLPQSWTQISNGLSTPLAVSTVPVSSRFAKLLYAMLIPASRLGPFLATALGGGYYLLATALQASISVGAGQSIKGEKPCLLQLCIPSGTCIHGLWPP